MARPKKKRNKKYQGADAKMTAPVIVRVEAEERSAFKEWWLTYGRLTKVVGVVVGAIIALIVIIIGLIGLF
jgi:hypothetical protein